MRTSCLLITRIIASLIFCGHFEPGGASNGLEILRSLECGSISDSINLVSDGFRELTSGPGFTLSSNESVTPDHFVIKVVSCRHCVNIASY